MHATTGRSGVTITGIDVTTYLAKDPARAIAFWRDTMGLTAHWSDDERGAEFALPDGSAFGIWKVDDKPDARDGPTPGHGIAFAVADLRAAVPYDRSRDVAIDDGIYETPACRMAFARDSEGNHFILHERKP